MRFLPEPFPLARSVFGLVLAFVIAGPALADDLERVRPERVGFDSARLERLTEHMHSRVADGTMVGGLGMIARNGKVAYVQPYGLRDREADLPMTEDTIFRIYSMTKPVTAVALMMLYEEGHFFLNDPVARYLPELGELEVAVSTADADVRGVSDGTESRTIGSGDESKVGQTRMPRHQPTIRDLLRHTAGLTYGIFGNTEVDQLYRAQRLMGRDSNLAQFVAELGQLPLQYEPGTRWHYSVAVDVQGRLVEVISGMRFGEFLEERIFKPLKMRDTGFMVPEGARARFAQLYSPEGVGEGDGIWRTRTSSRNLVVANPAMSRRYLEGGQFESGGGGLVSTADDYLRFAQMMLNGGALDGVRLLSPKTVELMTSDHLGDIPMGWRRRGMGFGLGFGISTDQAQIGELGSTGEYNWGGAAGTRFWVDPQEELIGIFMVQSLPHRTRLGREFKVLTYQALVE